MARRKKQEEVTPTADPRFEGSRFSNPEIEFLLTHLGKSSAQVEGEMDEDDELPTGVNEKSVYPVLDRTFQLDTYETAQRTRTGDSSIKTWAGFERLRAVLTETLEWRRVVRNFKIRTRGSSETVRRAMGAPSLHLWDPDTNIPVLGGVGADADIVITRIGPDNTRIPLYVELTDTGEGTIRSFDDAAKLLRAQDTVEHQEKHQREVPSDFVYERGDTTGVVKCPICGKTEEYVLVSASSKSEAMARIRKHLKTSSIKKEQHHIFRMRMESGKGGEVNRLRKMQKTAEAAAAE